MLSPRYVVVTLATKEPSTEIQEEFDKAAKLDTVASDDDLDFTQAANKLN